MEDLFSERDKSKLGWTENAGSKSVMLRRIQEIVASGEPWKFDVSTRSKMKKLIAGLESQCPQAFGKCKRDH